MTFLSSLGRATCVSAFFLGLSALSAHSDTFTVTNLNDSGIGSLRQALSDANTNGGDDVVAFAPAASGTIALASTLRVSGSVTITGPGADKLVLDGKGAVQGIVFSSGTSSLSGVTLANASLRSPGSGAGLLNESGSVLTLSECRFANNTALAGRGNPPSGGAIANVGVLTIKGCSFESNTAAMASGGAIFNGNVLTVSDSTFQANSAHLGGALYNGGTLFLSNSTFTENTVSSRTAFDSHGAAYVFSGLGSALYALSTAELTNCTFFNNTVTGQSSSPYAENRPGTIHSARGPLSLVNCTLSGNTDARTNASADVRIGTLVNLGRLSCLNTVFVSSQSRPFFGFDAPPSGGDDKSNFLFANNQSAGLDALRSNGGPVATMALLGTSPLRDVGQNLGSPPTDARGELRPFGTGIDVGAFEAQNASTPPPVLSINSPSIKEGSRGTTALTFTLTLSKASTRQVSVLVNTLQGTAKAGSDYVSVGRATVTFAPGTTKQTFTVQVVGDTLVERDEQFRLDLRSPINATIGTTSGIGTILNDDTAPKSPSFAGSAASS